VKITTGNVGLNVNSFPLVGGSVFRQKHLFGRRVSLKDEATCTEAYLGMFLLVRTGSDNLAPSRSVAGAGRYGSLTTCVIPWPEGAALHCLARIMLHKPKEK
jgi:hypothetical protein